MNIATDKRRFLEFSLASQHYAIPLLTVKEVLQKPEITYVPNMPRHFEGMMNIRGQVIGVFDVYSKFGLDKRDRQQYRDVVIIVEHEKELIGMTVDEINRVIHVNEDMLMPAPTRENDAASKYLKSVVKTDDGLVMIVDPVSLLDFASYQVRRSA